MRHFFGMIFGRWSAVNLWNKQIENMQKNVAFGFLIELDVLEDWISTYLNEIKKIEDLEGNPEGAREIQIAFYIRRFFENEIYSDIGTWNILKEKVYELPTDLCYNLDQFYSNILFAEKIRKIYMEQQMTQNKDRLVEHLTKANDLIPKLRVLLEETVNRK